MNRPLSSPVVVFEQTSLTVDSKPMDPSSSSFFENLVRCFGPKIEAFPVGGARSGRMVQVLDAGVLVLTHNGRVLCAHFCFGGRLSSPYSDAPDFPAFSGTVSLDTWPFTGGESETVIKRIPGLNGYAGMLYLKSGALRVDLLLRKDIGSNGRRGGVRRLVRVTADWNARLDVD